MLFDEQTGEWADEIAVTDGFAEISLKNDEIRKFTSKFNRE